MFNNFYRIPIIFCIFLFSLFIRFDSVSAETFSPLLDTQKEPFSVSDIMIVNKNNPIPKDFVPASERGGPVKTINSDKSVEAKKALNSMIAGAKNKGYSVSSFSGYRSYDKQKELYNNYVKAEKAKGKTDAQAKAAADKYSARPGYSEHQTGMAFDIKDTNAGSGCEFSSCGNTAGMKWLVQNAYNYGFVLRYTDSNKSWTGYDSEFWHFRYVGVENAQRYKSGNYSSLEQSVGMKIGQNLNLGLSLDLNLPMNKTPEEALSVEVGKEVKMTIDWSLIPEEHKKDMVLSPAYYFAYMKAKELGLAWTSGKRSEAGNQAVGGYDKSYHLQGKAADFSNGQSQTPEMDSLYLWAKESGMYVELLYSPLDNGKSTDHHDHVHIAWKDITSGEGYNGVTNSGSSGSESASEEEEYKSPFDERGIDEDNFGGAGINTKKEANSVYQDYKFSGWMKLIVNFLRIITMVASILIFGYVSIIWMLILLARTHMMPIHDFLNKISLGAIDPYNDLGKMIKVTLIVLVIVSIGASGLMPIVFILIYQTIINFLEYIF